VVPEIMCPEFRGNVAIWHWPTDGPIDEPYKQAEDSFKVLNHHFNQYAESGTNMLC
jgi:hypothetical protein